MSKDTDKSLFIVSSVPRLYQQLLSELSSYEILGNRIIRQIKAAHAFRQVKQVRELAGILVNIPIKECQLIAQYYLVWSQCRQSEYDTAPLERIAEQTQTYKAKVLISVAAFEVYKGNTGTALYFYTEALRTNPTPTDYIKASTGIATVKSMEGFHKSALNDLEKLLPVLRHAEALNYFEVFNSYAVELGEVGRKEEARNVIKHVLASPFIPAYPEWQETSQELREPGHSFVAVPSIEFAPVEIEAIEAHQASEPEQSPRVLPFPKLKQAPEPKKPEQVRPNEIEDMDITDKKELLMTAIRTGAIPESEYIKMMYMLGLVKSGPASEVLDLDDNSVLEDIAVVWSVQIGAEELAGFLSALRDCDDSSRRNDILDRLITKIFHQTQLCRVTEEEWRLRVERRLPKKKF